MQKRDFKPIVRLPLDTLTLCSQIFTRFGAASAETTLRRCIVKFAHIKDLRRFINALIAFDEDFSTMCFAWEIRIIPDFDDTGLACALPIEVTFPLGDLTNIVMLGVE